MKENVRPHVDDINTICYQVIEDNYIPPIGQGSLAKGYSEFADDKSN